MDKKYLFLTLFISLMTCYSAFCQIQAPVLTQKKMRIGLDAGTMFTSFGKGQIAFSTYANPNFTYQLSPKLFFQMGLLLVNQQMRIDMPIEHQRSNFMTNNAFLTAGLYYDVNEKMRLGGIVYTNMAQTAPNQLLNNFNQRNWGVLFNASYKVTENFTIHGAINISNGRNPYMINPWGNHWNQGLQMNQWGVPRWGNW
ncbi:MAG: hypothetical protein MUE81_17890 [Thermoflexibacter sp.]|jgi:predicted porin|nr:hypothetical protein [Thermoflexibacter sp.]